MVRFRPALIMGRLMPSRLRERLFEASYQELLADYLRGRSQRNAFGRSIRRLVFEGRALAMALDCWRLHIAERLFKQKTQLRVPGGIPPRDHRPGGSLMDSFARDVKYAVRQLAGAPVFTTTAILIVAIGIGVNTAAFSVEGSPPPSLHNVVCSMLVTSLSWRYRNGASSRFGSESPSPSRWAWNSRH